jgi:hypothetical protein
MTAGLVRAVGGFAVDALALLFALAGLTTTAATAATTAALTASLALLALLAALFASGLGAAFTTLLLRRLGFGLFLLFFFVLYFEVEIVRFLDQR